MRGINVGGKNRVPMAELREMVARLGLSAPRTLLHSGNLIFHGDAQPSGDLESLLEAETAKRFGFEVSYFVRGPEEWNATIAANPFPEAAARDPARVVAMVLKDAPATAAVQALQQSLTGPEQVSAHGRVLYAHYPIDIGNSRLTGALIERKLGTRGSARNWNTVAKLAVLAAEPG